MARKPHQSLGKPIEIIIIPDDRPHDPPRKIELDEHYWCPADHYVDNEDPNCDHDYPRKPYAEADSWIEYKCTKCGCTITFNCWD
jgi:hypothetical protein